MKKIIISLLAFFAFINTTFAHPLDISVSTWNIKWKNIDITTYFHSFEIEYLLKNNWINPDWVDYYYENENIIKEYVKNNSSLKNNNKLCEVENIELQKDEAYKILTNWLWVSYRFKCEENIKNLDLELRYFIEFPLQTNRITLYNLENWIKNLKPIIYKVLTYKIYNLKLDLDNLNIVRVDSDWDWLSDEEEKVYYTDINNIDTDGDNYTDKEEIDYWWNPLNKELWPGQEYREKLDLEISNKNINKLIEINSKLQNQNLSDYWYWNSYLEKVMKYINNFFEKWEWNLLVIFIIVFWLWVIHAIWPWHSKWILIAYTLEEWNWYKKWLFYAFVFTITHMIDILILFALTKVITSFIDTSKYVFIVQLISWIILFLISIYLLYTSTKKIKCKKTNPSLYTAFLVWLAPCSFAWSIYLLLLALWKSAWITPLIFALWLWILTTLSWIVILSVFLKNKIYSKIELLAKYSKILSASIIFIISIILLINIIKNII